MPYTASCTSVKVLIVKNVGYHDRITLTRLVTLCVNTSMTTDSPVQ